MTVMQIRILQITLLISKCGIFGFQPSLPSLIHVEAEVNSNVDITCNILAGGENLVVIHHSVFPENQRHFTWTVMGHAPKVLLFMNNYILEREFISIEVGEATVTVHLKNVTIKHTGVYYCMVNGKPESAYFLHVYGGTKCQLLIPLMEQETTNLVDNKSIWLPCKMVSGIEGALQLRTSIDFLKMWNSQVQSSIRNGFFLHDSKVLKHSFENFLPGSLNKNSQDIGDLNVSMFDTLQV